MLRRPAGSTSWTRAGDGFPPPSPPGLTIVPKSRVLYAATYGRSIWKIQLPAVPTSGNPATNPAPAAGGGAVNARPKVSAPAVVTRSVRVSRTRLAVLGCAAGASSGSRCQGTLTAASGRRPNGAGVLRGGGPHGEGVAAPLTRSAYRSLVAIAG